MAITSLRIKILPESPGINLENLKANLKDSLKKAGAIKVDFEIENIAFGLKALIATIAWPESLETEKAEEACKIQDVSSCEIIDYRRAFG